ncbi:tRNA pseudouridine(38-40) synthase TruA [Candidatus Purcelliella pentastirinorum]|uniref:tRNA pseudouridine synthase A n=1 Tax=Candidatus Purcelliella pentastirinorum TaxID=472834 RepID=A0AAX3N803_9ENTR|nr:tRNA pseudouridine(38-40) synthase TruA [Candidatus Purcelliella pentastirinorum]WDI78543.1 tRNA pseudouridine(38-40) synthase TruA [Candidatus Purcelliella pentastirinorum]WDR80428.1 tRNA pseudouridine(38-40) synthase TruA [Candidatus Purcelliella pentastirinorum]
MKIAIGIEYNGKNYSGWQKQKKKTTIQYHVEKALSKIANHKIKIICAGRTDKGVHSTGQVAHFTTKNKRNNSAWIIGTNSYLPKDITIIWAKKVSALFHARYSAIARNYKYIIYNNKIRSAIFFNELTQCMHPLNIKKMYKASQYLIGEHDFKSFKSKKCQSNSSKRTIMHINIFKYKNYIIIDIKANAFMYHMVRNIVGNLIEIGKEKKKESWMLKLLNLKNNNLNIPTAPAKGLYLTSINYPKYYNIPIIKISKPLIINKILFI